MSNQKVNNIILSCENENPNSLVDNTRRVLNNKLIEIIDNKRKEISGKILNESKSKKEDPYENYEPTVRECIDYVVESVLEGGLELENTIQMASKQYNVKEETVREYFDTFLETTKTEVKVDSTSSDDEDNKRGMRDDEDTNKRVRYEENTIVLEDGSHIVLTEDFWEKNIQPVIENLNEENRNAFYKILTQSKAGFFKAVDFCQKSGKELNIIGATMPYTNFVEAIENKQFLNAHELLEKTLYRKAGLLIEEKKKHVAAKSYPGKHLEGSDEKTIFNASRRQAFKEKIKKLGKKKEEKEE